MNEVIEKIKQEAWQVMVGSPKWVKLDDVLKILDVEREKLRELLNKFPIKHRFIQDDFVHDDSLKYEAYESSEVDEWRKKVELLFGVEKEE